VANEASLALLKQRYLEDPKDLERALDLVRRFNSLGRCGDALRLCRAAMKNHSGEYDFLLEFANVLYKNGDFKESRMIYRKLTDINPERVEAWNNLGILELSKGNLEEANAAFGKVLELNPDSVGALCNIGNYFAEKGDAAVGATYFERAIEVEPEFPDAWYNLGNAYMSLNQFKDARDALEKAIKYDKSFGSAYKNLGFVYEQLENYDKALDCYRKAAALNKSDAGVQVNMAGIYMRLDKYDKALDCGKRAASLAPGEQSSWNALRTAAIRTGDGETYYRAVNALISGISNWDLARSIADLREMGFDTEAEELLEYTVKINKGSKSVDALPFTESRPPQIATGGAGHKTYKIINKKREPAIV
jgi:superkiller protein 3